MTRTMDRAWHDVFTVAKTWGEEVSPRGMKVRELRQRTVEVDMRYPVLTLPDRKLNYRFMAAEAEWIISGRDDLASLTKYNPNMTQFSDNGVTLAGAYGPRIAGQLDFVVEKLLNDRDTRQATLTIWTPSPEESKDVPCTVAMSFMIREGLLNCHVYMRSSDIWLGLPYDVFSFSCVARYVAAFHNKFRVGVPVNVGTLYLTAASSHLYEKDLDRDVELIERAVPPMPDFGVYTHPDLLPMALRQLAETSKGDPMRWWES